VTLASYTYFYRAIDWMDHAGIKFQAGKTSHHIFSHASKALIYFFSQVMNTSEWTTLNIYWILGLKFLIPILFLSPPYTDLRLQNVDLSSPKLISKVRVYDTCCRLCWESWSIHDRDTLMQPPNRCLSYEWNIWHIYIYIMLVSTTLMTLMVRARYCRIYKTLHKCIN